ncbi:ParA family protein [Mycolicibacterium wolinskyi]|uniref:Cobyrinic acid a,c-diamide synthase n=1 Tax=Mycolicibacterium wolinskyi TaxID=59750 RepID=A0A1X2F4F9_9MYCO|nr:MULTISPECIES: ParA family protein [Mycolicibacterium]MCV7289084.1 ParA family protein [Mycolicibacterium wolinskyi]MCV7296511.1 ParA family protein [Mycolicibacterium goodii]ORX13286.1 cobyrinic acid a,c-diamide synthase [Mycolicibacterium wolinskyi]
MKIYATYNIKGGVGKTSAAVNLAHLSGREGNRTLLWDLDPQGAATYLFRIRPKVKGGSKALVRGTRSLDEAIKATDFDLLDLVPADFTYRNMDVQLDSAKRPTRRIRQLLAPLEDEYDVVFLDCPPSISLVSENVLHAVDTLLVPMIPATLSVRTFDQLVDFVGDFDGRQPAVKAFFSMVDRRKKLHRDVVAQLSQERQGILSTDIPALSVIEQMAEKRAPVTAFAPQSSAAQQYEALWNEIR